jgi:hypothetical protein
MTERRSRRLLRAWVAIASALSCLAMASSALADKVAVLPFQSTAAATSADLDAARAAARTAVTALSHKLPTDAEMLTAQMSSTDGVVDTTQEYKAAGRASTSQWTVAGHVEGHGATYNLELEVCLVETGRVETLAREITPSVAATQIQEMLALLLRPEGIANAVIPWERSAPAVPPKPAPPPPVPVPPPPPPPPPGPPPPPAVRHAYAEGHPLALGLSGTVLSAIERPSNAIGSSTAGLLGGTLGYAIAGAPGLELRGDVQGSVAGPKSISFDVGARYAIPLVPSIRLFFGPEATFGGFFTSGADKTGRALIQGAAFVALGLGERVQLDVTGNIAYAAGSPSLALGGGGLRALVRF